MRAGSIGLDDPLTLGTYFTPDLDGPPQIAVKNTNIMVTEGNANTNNSGAYVAMFPFMQDTEYASPRLAPTLQQVFFIRSVSAVPSLQRATRTSSGSWTTTRDVVVRIPSLDADSVETPYLSEDCLHYYYTSTLSGQIQHVTY